MLQVDATKRFEQLTIEVTFESAGGVTALFGRSGAGKTSIISMIAGLLRPDRGTIALDGETLDNTSAGVHLPAYRRRIGYVFQDARLFPHMSVGENLDYGRRMNGHPQDEAASARVTKLLDLDDLLTRRPGRLSGGEKQRVALARAKILQPKLLLLDEPTANLDGQAREQVIELIPTLDDLCQPQRRRGPRARDAGDHHPGWPNCRARRRGRARCLIEHDPLRKTGIHFSGSCSDQESISADQARRSAPRTRSLNNGGGADGSSSSGSRRPTRLTR